MYSEEKETVTGLDPMEAILSKLTEAEKEPCPMVAQSREGLKHLILSQVEDLRSDDNVQERGDRIMYLIHIYRGLGDLN